MRVAHSEEAQVGTGHGGTAWIVTVPRRLVALRARGLGDLLVVVPALRALRRHFPEHELTLVTHAWLAPLIPLIGGIDRSEPTRGLVPLIQPRRPDIAVNLHGAGDRSAAALDALDPQRRIHRVVVTGSRFASVGPWPHVV